MSFGIKEVALEAGIHYCETIYMSVYGLTATSSLLGKTVTNELCDNMTGICFMANLIAKCIGIQLKRPIYEEDQAISLSQDFWCKKIKWNY